MPKKYFGLSRYGGLEGTEIDLKKLLGSPKKKVLTIFCTARGKVKNEQKLKLSEQKKLTVQVSKGLGNVKGHPESVRP
jgi:hypothetical protein